MEDGWGHVGGLLWVGSRACIGPIRGKKKKGPSETWRFEYIYIYTIESQLYKYIYYICSLCPWPAVKETVTVPTERIDEVVHEDVLLLMVGARQGQARCELIVRLEDCVCLGLW